MKILIVDDSKMSRKLLRRALPESITKDSEIYEATNGQEGVATFEAERPDLTFLDLTMPIMDGFEALKLIKDIDQNADVVVVSADIQSEAVSRVLQLGARQHMKKPANQDVMAKVVSESPALSSQ